MDFYEANILYSFILPIKSSFLDSFFSAISFLFNNGYLPITVGIILMFFRKHRKTGLRILTALLIGLLIGNGILKPLIGRMRPFEIIHLPLTIPELHDFSFPSGHTQAAFAFASSIFISNKKAGIFCYVLAFVVGFSRIYLLVHYPTDVICGMLLGILWGYCSDIIISKINNK